MRIRGQELVVCNTKDLRLKRGDVEFTITVAAYSPGFQERLRGLGLLDFGKPPKKLKLDAKKRPIFNQDGTPYFEDQVDDPNYVAQRNKAVARWQALRVAEALRKSEDLEFDAKQPEGFDKDAWATYADHLAAELCDPERGFTDAEITTILDVADKLEGGLNPMAAVDDFLPESQ